MKLTLEKVEKLEELARFKLTDFEETFKRLLPYTYTLSSANEEIQELKEGLGEFERSEELLEEQVSNARYTLETINELVADISIRTVKHYKKEELKEIVLKVVSALEDSSFEL